MGLATAARAWGAKVNSGLRQGLDSLTGRKRGLDRPEQRGEGSDMRSRSRFSLSTLRTTVSTGGSFTAASLASLTFDGARNVKAPRQVRGRPRFIFLHSLFDLTTGYANAAQDAVISVIAMNMVVFSFCISYHIILKVNVCGSVLIWLRMRLAHQSPCCPPPEIP